jgi:hypothetical protein
MQAAKPDPSLMRRQLRYKENLDYVATAVQTGAYVTCPKCSLILGVGPDRARARATSIPCPEHGLCGS